MSVEVISSPEDIALAKFKSFSSTIFLGGGISNCPNWQDEFITDFSVISSRSNKKYLLINPRRSGDLARTGYEAEKQIKWERAYLQYSSHAIFWFPKESVCPITLFELGQYATEERLISDKTIVGVEAGYQREFDLEIQLSLVAGTAYRPYKTIWNLATGIFRSTE